MKRARERAAGASDASPVDGVHGGASHVHSRESTASISFYFFTFLLSAV